MSETEFSYLRRRYLAQGRDLPLDAWGTHNTAMGMPEKEGSHVDDHDDYWPEEGRKDKKEEKKEKTEEGKVKEGEAEESQENASQEGEDAREKAEKNDPGRAHVESVIPQNRPLTPSEIEGLNMIYRAPAPTPPAQGELATPIRPQYIPPASSVYRPAPEQDTGPTGTTSRPLRRSVKPKRPGKGIEGMIRKMFKPSVRNAAQTASRGLLSSPVGWIIILLAVLFVTALFLILKNTSIDLGSDTDTGVVPVVPGEGGENVPGIPGMSLNTTVPSDTVGRNDPITYTITAIYSGDLDVTVYNPVASNAEYVSSTPEGGQYDEVSRTRSWRLNDVTPVATDGETRTYVFTITLRPAEALHDVPKVTIINKAYATAASPVVVPGTPPDLGASVFEELMKGQGRNTGILGNEDQFVTAVLANAGSRMPEGGANHEQYLRQLYETAVANNINPLIMLTIWGVEQSFAINGTEFGCDPRGEGRGAGFEWQVQCSADTLNRWMNDFDEKAAQGIFPVPYDPSWSENHGCTFEDPFVYAYEAYTPVCSMNDGNSESRENFVIIFKDFLQ